MGATDRHIDDVRRDWSTRYWNARCWMEVLNQRTYWVPRGAWTAYKAATLHVYTTQDVAGEHPDGTPVTTGPLKRHLMVRPDFNVAGVVHVADMDVPWRRNVISFLWRKQSTSLCAALSHGCFIDNTFDDAPDDVIEQVIDADIAYLEYVSDDDARYRWFNELPLIDELRNSIIVDRDLARGDTILGNPDGFDEVADPHLIELTRTAEIERRRRT